MQADPNWSKWLHASVYNHFSQDDVLNDMKFFTEDMKRDTNRVSEWLEVRIDGPRLEKTGTNNWIMWAEVNLLVSTHKNSKKLLRHQQNIGSVVAAITDIPIYRYGDEDGDDGSLVGCLQLIQDFHNKIDVIQMQVVEHAVELLQSMAEGHYRMYL